MKVLVLGANGQLGRCLADQLKGTDHNITLSSRAEIDIADMEKTYLTIIDLKPDVVINATAYTAVDKAESDLETADLINHLSVANIANICADIDCVLIHVSTDYVFDGEANLAYTENDETNPQGVYGQTKLLGEVAVQESGCNYLILRTAWVFSEYGNNFLKVMLRLAKERDSLSVVADQFGCPTYAQDIARAIIVVLGQIELKNTRWGIYHYCGDKPASWFDFAQTIFDEASQANVIDKSPILTRIKTEEFPTLAKRPAFSVLDSSKIMVDWGVDSSNLVKAVREVIAKV